MGLAVLDLEPEARLAAFAGLRTDEGAAPAVLFPDARADGGRDGAGVVDGVGCLRRNKRNVLVRLFRLPERVDVVESHLAHVVDEIGIGGRIPDSRYGKIPHTVDL